MSTTAMCNFWSEQICKWTLLKVTSFFTLTLAPEMSRVNAYFPPEEFTLKAQKMNDKSIHSLSFFGKPSSFDVLKEQLCKALGVSPNALDATLGEQPYTHAKLIRYPAQQAAEQGVGAHKDPGYLTFVIQDEQSGLKVERDNQWVNVEPIAGALVVNIGELLEMASNGFLKATNHKVESPTQGVERYSIAFFMAAQLSATVPVLSLPPELKAQALGPSTDPNNPLLTDVGNNVLKGRLRSHPHVTREHYCSEPLKQLLAENFTAIPTADICSGCRA